MGVDASLAGRTYFSQKRLFTRSAGVYTGAERFFLFFTMLIGMVRKSLHPKNFSVKEGRSNEDPVCEMGVRKVCRNNFAKCIMLPGDVGIDFLEDE